jgi:hypothetical protein
MEQRPLRLGDLVDDYCPRERRITNHAIVAIVEHSIRQTRCTTCDAEHVYKEGKSPRRRKAASDADAASNQGGQLIVPTAVGEGPDDVAIEAEATTPPAAATEDTDPPPVPDGDDNRHEDGWAAHRPLIRATLPRTEGDAPPPRPIPEFTMHQRHTRGAHAFRHSGWNDRGGSGRNGGRGFGRQGHGGNGHGNSFGNSHGRHQHGKHRGKKGQ